MKALEIWEQDEQLRQQEQTLPPRQEYYTALRDALYRELMRSGYSQWLEQIYLECRNGERSRLYAVDWAVLMECHSMIVGSKAMRDASTHIPHLNLRGEKAPWSLVDRPGSHTMPVTREMVESIRQLRSVSHQLSAVRETAFAGQEAPAHQQEIEQVQLLNRMLDERCKALTQERDDLLQRVKELEEGVISEQLSYAIQARKLRQDAEMDEAYARQREAAREAFRTQYEREEAIRLQQLEREDRQIAAQRQDMAEEYACVRRSMAEDLRQLETLVQARIDQWQNALEHAECRMLARSYLNLYTLSRDEYPRLCMNARLCAAPEAVLQALGDMQLRLEEQVRHLEASMLRLGLTVLRPQPGERFQPGLHMAQGAAAQDGVIAECTLPGVAMVQAQEALIRAQVMLK